MNAGRSDVRLVIPLLFFYLAGSHPSLVHDSVPLLKVGVTTHLEFFRVVRLGIGARLVPSRIAMNCETWRFPRRVNYPWCCSLGQAALRKQESWKGRSSGRLKIFLRDFKRASCKTPALFLPLPATKEWGEDRGGAIRCRAKKRLLSPPLLHPMEERE